MEKGKLKKVLLVIGLIILGIFIYISPFLLMTLSFYSSEVIITDDVGLYQDVIGKNAKDVYQNKWDMSEEIFPSDVADLNVIDFKMVYYDPWDKQFLSYLIVDYGDDIDKELNRLLDIKATEYKGYYGVTGFNENYGLIAINADSYQGFVYALREIGTTSIIYVEMIFCNYYYDLDYMEYIDNKYLPVGFDATIDNPYSKKMLE